MSGLTVAHLTNCLEIGGTERSILNLCRHSPGKQFVVSPEDGPIRGWFESSGIEVRVGSTADQLVDCLTDASVVNIHWCTYIPRLFAATVQAGKPMVCTLQWLSVLPPLPAIVICASQRVYEIQENNRDNLRLITNGVDTSLFRPAAKRGDPVSIIRVCRPAQCEEYFWPAMMRVLTECPEARLTIIGGPQFLSGRVAGLGYRDDVHLLLPDADLFAYTPRPAEGAFDLVVLEAMACGLPCVVSNVPCVNEAVENEATGLLVPFQDVDALASSVVRLIRDPGLRLKMANCAAATARAKFDIRQRVPHFAQAYEEAYADATLPLQLDAWRQRLFGRTLSVPVLGRRMRWRLGRQRMREARGLEDA